MNDTQATTGAGEVRPWAEIARLAESWQQTKLLRWARPAEKTTEPDKLQFAWRSMSTGELRWEDVPLVVLPALAMDGGTHAPSEQQEVE